MKFDHHFSLVWQNQIMRALFILSSRHAVSQIYILQKQSYFLVLQEVDSVWASSHFCQGIDSCWTVFWFLLLTHFKKWRGRLAFSFFFWNERTIKITTKKFHIWFLVTGWCNKRNIKCNCISQDISSMLIHTFKLTFVNAVA